MSTWVTSDTHFGHQRIIELANRPFTQLDEMHEHLIKAWRDWVEPKDRVFVLGDFAFCKGEELERIWKALPGEKHLVLGNHDERNAQVLRLPWASQSHIARIREGGARLLGCHYPMETWPDPQRYVHVHGHSHGTLKTRRLRRVDVGVDAGNFLGWGRPYHIQEIWGQFSDQVYESVDNHGGVM